MFFSKSKYCSFWQCPKITWLDKYKPEEKEIDTSLSARLSTGNEVGDLAMTLFGDFVETTTLTEDNKLDYSAMIQKTADEIANGTENICEAAFSYNGLYCAVDILHKEQGGYAIYEIKSSTHLNYIYLVDVAYQKYVLEKSGIKVTGTYLVNINNEYVRHGDINVKELFFIQDVGNFLQEEYDKIDETLKRADEILNNETDPNIDISDKCTSPYSCAYWKYCTKHLPTPNVFDIYHLGKGKKFEYYNNGIISFEDLEKHGHLDYKQTRQIDYYLHNKGTYMDKNGIKKFLDTLSYPLYFLDFETMQSVIPQFDGTKPYQQIPFQYSLHYIESEGGEVKHKEFLAVSGENPLRAIAESLCANIPMNVCTLAYNKKFECGRIKELAEIFPDLSKHLLNIERNIKDLLDPFQKGYYYNKVMGGSFSIKSVLPAIFPDDPSLNYHNLDGVHNGAEAMTIFPLIKDMPKEEQEIARQNLLKYCELDTFAMVKIWEELIKSVNS
ncbi:MAG: DUF2779 domain-containing protein [Clostridia bacterium]|nr:DUF2779 domain-containing protein [Clostridia bacterium]